MTEGKRKTGRPKGSGSLKTPEITAAIAEAVERTMSLSAACREVGIGLKTAYDWMDDDPAFAADVARARARACERTEDEFEQVARTPTNHPDDVQHRKLILFALEKRLRWNNRERYGDKHEVEHSGGVSVQVVTGVDRTTPPENGVSGGRSDP